MAGRWFPVAATDLDHLERQAMGAVSAASEGSRPEPSVSSAVSVGERAALTVGWVALFAPFALELLAILRANHVALVLRLPDDGFYYLEIAARLARGQGFTFDGVHATTAPHCSAGSSQPSSRCGPG